ncbi:MAG TPA: hypothetical protein VG244_08610 [Acidimicrobiales bacterium]|jgi:uncharacterized membrane protein|nr:hypothetical protein [Acidimicrobiales bacterium]
MTLDPSMPAEYLIGHLEDALACDPRVTEQGLHVAIRREPFVAVVSGTVLSAQHKAQLAEVVGDLLPDALLEDETEVAGRDEQIDTEEVT